MRLINAEELKHILNSSKYYGTKAGNAFADMITECTTIEVRQPLQEVKHAHWAHLGGDEWCCTNCGDVISTEGSWDKPTRKCCSNCGADMREDKTDEV